MISLHQKLLSLRYDLYSLIDNIIYDSGFLNGKYTTASNLELFDYETMLSDLDFCSVLNPDKVEIKFKLKFNFSRERWFIYSYSRRPEHKQLLDEIIEKTMWREYYE